MARNAREDGARLLRCAVLFEAGEPPRDGRMAFWEADEAVAVVGPDTPAAQAVAAVKGGRAWRRPTPIARVPVADAVSLLSRARHARDVHPAAAYWSEVTVFALQLIARGRLLPGVSVGDLDTWRIGPFDTVDGERLIELAATMPMEARTVEALQRAGQRVPGRVELVRAYLDAVADSMPRSADAARTASGLALAAVERPRLPELPDLPDPGGEPAGTAESRLRVALRLDLPLDDLEAVRAIVQVRSLDDPTAVADAAELWTIADHGFGPRAQFDTMMALRQGARVWAPLVRLLHADVPDALSLGDDEVEELLGGAATRLAGAGIDVLWPRELAREVTARRGGLGADEPPVATRTFFGGDAVLRFDWQLALGGEPLTEEEMDRLAEAHRPIVRLRDQWVLVDAEISPQARERAARPLAPIDALAAALTGEAAIDGRAGRVHAERLARHAARAHRRARRRARARRAARGDGRAPCATTSCAACAGSTGWPRSGSAAAWPTTWAWARRSP